MVKIYKYYVIFAYNRLKENTHVQGYWFQHGKRNKTLYQQMLQLNRQLQALVTTLQHIILCDVSPKSMRIALLDV